MAALATLAGRQLFAFCLLAAWMNSLLHALSADRLCYTRGIEWRAPVRWSGASAWALALTPVFLAAAELFAWRLWEGFSGAAVFLLLWLIRRIECRQWPGDTVVALGKYAPAAAALAGYLAAFWITAGSALSAREACGWEAACGVMAAAYCLAGVAKHRKAGWRGWLRRENLALLVAERSGGSGLMRSCRDWIASSPRLCRLLAGASLVLEDAGALFVFPWFRWPFAWASLFLQGGIAAFLGYVELEWAALTVALCLGSLPAWR